MYLVDEIHLGLAKVLTLEDQTPIPEALTDTDQLKHFARESEVNNDMKLADQFYLEVRIKVCYVVEITALFVNMYLK